MNGALVFQGSCYAGALPQNLSFAGKAREQLYFVKASSIKVNFRFLY